MNYNINAKLLSLVIAGLLCAIAILIPVISPFKIIIEPASFTLGSHIPIFIAMFVSPMVAGFVALGSALGFFLSGLPLAITLRALSHIVFAVVGALLLKKYPHILDKFSSLALFAVGISILHGLCEVLIISPMYFGNAMQEGFYQNGFIRSIIVLVGGGSIVHSLIDFTLALIIWKPFKKAIKFN